MATSTIAIDRIAAATQIDLSYSLGSADVHGSLSPHQSATNSISISSSVSVALTRVPNTHRPRDLVTPSAAIGRIHTMQAMRPNNNNNNNDDDDDDHTSPVTERPRGRRISQETDDLRDSAFLFNVSS